jgi:GINS complex subunit 4
MDTLNSSAALSEEGNDEDFETPHQVYKRLVQVTINEGLAPEVLPYEEAVVDCIVDQIEHMHENLKRLAPRLGTFCTEQHRMELERFSFIVNKYLRTRLEKVEKSAQSLVRLMASDKTRARRLLSEQELRFLEQYVSATDEHMARSVLQELPPNMRQWSVGEVPLNEKQAFERCYVFVKAVNRSSVIVDDPVTGQEVVELEKGSQHFLPYSSVRPHLQSGSKDLLLL